MARHAAHVLGLWVELVVGPRAAPSPPRGALLERGAAPTPGCSVWPAWLTPMSLTLALACTHHCRSHSCATPPTAPHAQDPPLSPPAPLPPPQVTSHPCPTTTTRHNRHPPQALLPEARVSPRGSLHGQAPATGRDPPHCSARRARGRMAGAAARRGGRSCSCSCGGRRLTCRCIPCLSSAPAASCLIVWIWCTWWPVTCVVLKC
jgi:hypothetical protein